MRNDPPNNSPIYKKYWHEGVLALVGLGVSAFLYFKTDSRDAGIIVASFSAFIAISVSFLKMYISRRVSDLINSMKPMLKRTKIINDIFSELNGENHKYASIEHKKYIENLKSIKGNEIPISEGVYYDKLSRKIKQTECESEIYAVNSINIKRWVQDSRQITYMQDNYDAIERGVNIHRIFILDENDLTNPVYKSSYEEVLRQSASKIDITIIWRDNLKAESQLIEDWVLFADSNSGSAHEKQKSEVYHSTADSSDNTRVAYAVLKLGKKNADAYKKKFKMLLKYRGTDDEQNGALSKLEVARKEYRIYSKTLTKGCPPPGEDMLVTALHEDVLSCKQAANAKGIPLNNELKTIIFQTNEGLIAVHLLAHRRYSLPKIETKISVSIIRQASKDDLASLKNIQGNPLEYGTISPVFTPVWNLRHFLDNEVMTASYVSTNNGTLNQCVFFRPHILLAARDIEIFDFAVRS